MRERRTGSLRERKPGIFEAQVDLGGTKQDGSRNRRYMTIRADSKAAAELELKRVLENGDAPASGTLEAMLVGGWLRTERYKWREATLTKYAGIVSKHILPFIGERPMAEFTKPDGKAFYATLRENGRSENTVKGAHKMLSLAFSAVVENDELERNPVSGVKMLRPKVKEMVPPSEAQVADMLELAREGGTWWHPATRLAAYTGLRRGELLGLLWRNVNLADGYLEVRQSLTYVSGHLRIETPKTDASTRRVDLDSGTVEILLEHKREQEAHILAMGAEYVDQGIVFTPNPPKDGV